MGRLVSKNKGFDVLYYVKLAQVCGGGKFKLESVSGESAGKGCWGPCRKKQWVVLISWASKAVID